MSAGIENGSGRFCRMSGDKAVIIFNVKRNFEKI